MNIRTMVEIERLCKIVWPEGVTTSDLLAKLLEEAGELSGAICKLRPNPLRPDMTASEEELFDHVEEEFGDVLFVLTRIAARYNINPSVALEIALQKFQKRLDGILPQ